MPDLYRIYIDDSGNVDAPTTNALDVRYGSITAVILADDYLQTKFNRAFDALSEKHFGLDSDGRPHNIHRRALSHPQPQGPFAVLRDIQKRVAWDAAVISMFSTAQYTVITACVDKVEWYFRYPTWTGDFYEVLVEAVLERCFYFLKNRDGVAEVNVETKNPDKNERIKVAYRRALLHGFAYIGATKVRERFTSVELNILKKSDRRPGVQLADLLASPSLQFIRYLKTGRNEITSEFVNSVARILEEHKYYREERMGPDGLGRIWRPKATT
jgi:uncharacterized protein DUF3800